MNTYARNRGTFTNDEGRRVALIRRLREMTQREVAYRAGLKAGYVSSIELGKNPLTPEVATRLGVALGVGKEYLMKGGEISLK